MTTNTNIARRAWMTGMPAAKHSPAQYLGAAGLRVACPGTSSLNRGGGRTIERGAFRPEGLRRVDLRQTQN